MSTATRSRHSHEEHQKRLPPHDLNAEAALLGAMLLHADTIAVAAEQVSAGEFYKPAHGYIFKAITDLYGRGEPADSVTVADELRRTERLDDIGGASALISLMADAPGTSGALRYTRIVFETAQLRHLAQVSSEINDLAYAWPQDVDETHDKAEALLFALRREQSNDIRSIGSGLGEWLDVLDERMERGGVPLHPTGWRDLDAVIGGLHASRLLIVGGRPGMGKTSWSNELALSVAKRGEPVLVVSVEMAYEELLTRYVAYEARLSSSDLDRGKVSKRDWDWINPAMERLAQLPVDVIDVTTATLTTIRAAARRVVQNRGTLGLVIVDYLQLMAGTKHTSDRRLEVEEVARGLKLLARELRIPVVALSQLNRGLETRHDKRPGLADLRETGEIENAADAIVFLFREGYYDKAKPGNIAEFIVAKNRHGPLGTVNIAVDLRSGHWRDLTQKEERF